MARFHYRMQSILDVKLKLEDQARQEFGAKKMALDEQEKKLEHLRMRKQEYEDTLRSLLNGTLPIHDIQDMKNAIHRMEDFIITQIGAVKKAEEDLEEAREKLTQIVQERKMHEKLKEHAFEEFLEEEKHAESKEVDELTSYTYGQRRKTTNQEKVKN